MPKQLTPSTIQQRLLILTTLRTHVRRALHELREGKAVLTRSDYQDYMSRFGRLAEQLDEAVTGYEKVMAMLPPLPEGTVADVPPTFYALLDKE